MEKLTEKQIEDVIRWMNNWVQLAGTGIPIRFKEDYIKRLNLACVIVPVCDHKEYRWMQEAGKEFDECVNCGHRKQTKL